LIRSPAPMMNRVNDVLVARRLQYRMVQAIAGYDA
jgi:hypothetical protein